MANAAVNTVSEPPSVPLARIMKWTAIAILVAVGVHFF